MKNGLNIECRLTNNELRRKKKNDGIGLAALRHSLIGVRCSIFKRTIKSGLILWKLLMSRQNKHTLGIRLTALALLIALAAQPTDAQDSAIRYGRGVPSTVRLINERSLTYLAVTQQKTQIPHN